MSNTSLKRVEKADDKLASPRKCVKKDASSMDHQKSRTSSSGTSHSSHKVASHSSRQQKEFEPKPITLKSAQTTRPHSSQGQIKREKDHKTDHFMEIYEVLIDPNKTSFVEPVPRRLPGYNLRSQRPVFRPLNSLEDVETDGVDSVDGPVTGQEHSDLLHKQQLYKDIAQRIRHIADEMFASMEQVDKHQGKKTMEKIAAAVGGAPLSHVQQTLSTKCFPDTLLDVVYDLLVAEDYSEFRSAVQHEAEKTIGWEQVAWSTLLINVTRSVAAVNEDIYNRVSAWARAYFSSDIRQWLEERPNGWESVL